MKSFLCGLLLLPSGAIALIPAIAFGGEVKVQLSVQPSSILAGMAAAFVVTVVNDSDTPADVPKTFQVIVSPAGREQYLAAVSSDTTFHLPLNSSTSPEETDGGFRLDASSSRQFYFSATSLLGGNPVFEDARLNEPNDYTFRILLDGAQASNAAKLSVREASGADAETLLRLKSVADGKWRASSSWGHHLLEVTNIVPLESEYNFAAAPHRALDPKSLIDIARVAPEGYKEELALAAAFSAQSFGNAEFGRGDIDATLAAYELAKEALEVAGSDLPAPLREQASIVRADLKNRGELLIALEELRDAMGTRAVKVKAFVKCVDVDTRGMTAVFGYEHTERDVAVIVPAGAENKVAPGAIDQGQPKFFSPGRTERAFTATTDGAAITWHLQGARVVADRSSARCND